MLSIRSLALRGGRRGGRNGIIASTTTSQHHNYDGVIIRNKHSSRQVKRLFQRNPAKRRIDIRSNKGGSETTSTFMDQQQQPTYPAILEPKFLSNGWCPPPSENIEIPNYPFQVSRTKNKPNDAVGFLPVYSEFRKDGAKVTTRIKKVTGDRDAFLDELRSVLQIPKPKNPKFDEIRIRTGGTIELKGNRKREVSAWLAGLGF